MDSDDARARVVTDDDTFKLRAHPYKRADKERDLKKNLMYNYKTILVVKQQ